MKRIYLLLALVFVGFGMKAKADEGMWLPHLIQGQTYDEMVRLGIKLTPEQIYDVNNSSLKDAIVRLGGGFCTGEMISAEGLMLTNHHCGFSAIQSLSSVDHDYLQDGFWAMKRSDELAAGFSVSFLVKIVDVTDKVTEGLTESMSAQSRSEKIRGRYKDITKEYDDKDAYISSTVKSFYEGNKYYVFVYQTYPDVRLVGAPPQSLGKYGGDTDNWMWPRHTCDFSMFRIYAGKDNKPAEYSTDNVPYKPKHHLPVSMKGVEKDDYAMIFGYPGSTDRYLTSYGVKFATDVDQPSRVKVRRAKLDIYEKYMTQDQATRIAYAAKHAQVSNYWKYFIGQTKGLKRLNVYGKKKSEETAFNTWATADADRKKLYGDVINLYEKGFQTKHKYQLSQTYINEAIFGIESIAYAAGFRGLAYSESDEDIAAAAAALAMEAPGHFKDFRRAIDEEVCAEMLMHFYQDIPVDQQPADFVKMVTKSKGDFKKIAAKLFKKSIMADQEKVMAFLAKPNVKKLEKDPIYNMMNTFLVNYLVNVRPAMAEANESLNKAKRLYVKGLMEMNPDHRYASDANSTMRVTYGKVLDYFPADAVHYSHFTTMDGVMEKYVPGDLEFDLPKRFIDLAEKREYGKYADKDGELHICFLSNNDITGGNSGSPVINGEGHLIGTAFDGNWEAMSGDIAFEDQLQRTISVDIRYTLWVIDVFAKAGHLVDEMTIIK
ncbi:MAG: S46 family peptidase [Bacteroidia bacterium]|nr:S46 family peptidase [Bacteroidia bacterium]